MKTQTSRVSFIFRAGFFLSIFCAASTLMAADSAGLDTPLANHRFAPTSNSDDDKLIDEYIKSKGYQYVISFDASNIKQYWVDKSVVSQDGLFSILLKYDNGIWKSVPLKIQLANVNETLDCTVDVVTDDSDFSFNLLDNKARHFSSSVQVEDFIKYHIASSTFHLEDTTDSAFSLQFNAKTPDTISIRKIFLSFSSNTKTAFLASPGKLTITKDNVDLGGNTVLADNSSFSVKGKSSAIFSKNNIIVSPAPIVSSVKVRNTGDTPARVYIGYRVHSKDGTKIDCIHLPYKAMNKILDVVSAKKGSDKIIVTPVPEWIKGCRIAINAKADLSDIPNRNLLTGTIVGVSELPNNQVEITMSNPLTADLEKGTKVRVNSPVGSTFLYTNQKILNPDEEEVFSSSISKDDSILEYSLKGFPQGTYYVVPIIVSTSIDSTKENTVLISDFNLSF